MANSISPSECRNGTTVSSLLGLNYTLLCGIDIQALDIKDFYAETLEECIDKCTRSIPGCLGVVWDTRSKGCHLKTNEALRSSLQPMSNFHSAMRYHTQSQQIIPDVVCPHPNLSKQKAKIGLEFKIMCGANLPGNDIFDVNTENRTEMRAKTLNECMESCAKLYPRCTHISYHSDSSTAPWMNCFHKTGTRTKAELLTHMMSHSAYVLQPAMVKTGCSSNSPFSSSNGKSFKLSCDDYRGLGDPNILPIEVYHELSINDCIKRCAFTTPKCMAALFDVGLESGYQNCYLFSALPQPNQRRSNYTFIYLESETSRYSPPPYSQRILRKSVVFEVVVGITSGLVACLLLVAFRYWLMWRQRKSKKA